METQTRFDLNNALENWRLELAAQPNITTEARRELETHLRESMAELRRRGLNDEESFWLARRRVGEPSLLAGEFVKSDPTKAWRERAKWIVMGLFASDLWQEISNALFRVVAMIPSFLPEWMRFYLPNLEPGSRTPDYIPYILYITFTLVPVVWIGIYVAGGRAGKFRMLQTVAQSRSHFILFALMLVLLGCLSRAIYLPHGVYSGAFRSFMLLEHLPLQLSLMAAIVWLMPRKSGPPAVARMI